MWSRERFRHSGDLSAEASPVGGKPESILNSNRRC